ncbi:MAG: flagellar biosynthesis anti-sigma factor FlgM [Clostridium sp.]|uniref:flagellar biosynthesis anti-sigma factor FlgM n=1 Tax=Clostridium sp. TaxID=1506 RepID=UPI002FCB0E2D
MKIEGKNNVVINAYFNSANNIKANKVNVAGNDRIEISSAGKEISKFIEEYKDIELVNDRIYEIKDKVKNGTYKVASEDLAKAIIKDIKRGV